jgi:hypothetical protein
MDDSRHGVVTSPPPTPDEEKALDERVNRFVARAAARRKKQDRESAKGIVYTAALQWAEECSRERDRQPITPESRACAEEICDALDLLSPEGGSTKQGVMVRFECGQEDRWSEEYGPFEFVQLTYGELRTGPDGESFAYYEKGEWKIIGDDSGVWYSDVIVWTEEESRI